MDAINHECTFRWFAILPATPSLYTPPPSPRVASRCDAYLYGWLVPVSLAVYDMKIFTFLYLLSAPLPQVFNCDDQKELTGWLFMVVNRRWGVSKVCLIGEEMGFEGVNWIVYSQFRAVLKTGVNSIFSIKDWNCIEHTREFRLLKKGFCFAYLARLLASYCQCLTVDSMLTLQFGKNSLQLTICLVLW